jgi:hypothetical protein
MVQMFVFKDVQNRMGETALHWAMRAGKYGKKVTCALLNIGARVSIYNYCFRRPSDVAAMMFKDVDEAMLRNFVQRDVPDVDASSLLCIKQVDKSTHSLQDKQETRFNFFQHSPQSRTLVLHHPECLDHIPKAECDWESPERVQSIIKLIEDTASSNAENIHEYEIQLSSEFERASLEVLSRVHSAEYLAFVHDLSKELEQRNSCIGNKAIPLTPVVRLSFPVFCVYLFQAYS